MLVNIAVAVNGFKEGFFEATIVSEQVTITNKYEITHHHYKGGTTSSHYMTGQNENGYYKIPGDAYDIGDVVTVYQNPESANAKGGDPEWHTSEAAVYNTAKFSFVLFTIFAIINGVVVYLLFKPKKEEPEQPPLSQCLDDALIDGRMKIQRSFDEIIAFVFLLGLAIGMIAVIIICIMDGDYNVAPGVIAAPILLYYASVSALAQNPNNYRAEMPDKTFNTFRLYYKDEEIFIPFECADDGRFKYKTTKNPIDDIAYTDGYKMSARTKQKINSYLTLWLRTNHLFYSSPKAENE
ncbi:hypothetical protein [Pseudobutyrivibrio sp. YE44]|uniref:hypothetical protein n=1 Tax=Pseudobutyrivibrio sp. YE44 TaxID=1520802 RepID=UPI00115F9F0B|nr:hypothetical protein [Pseudobutyrivibrio sp. YE44]